MVVTAMRGLYGWRLPNRHPVLVLLPEADYRRLREAWRLPALMP